jgi:hypothetical protein
MSGTLEYFNVSGSDVYRLLTKIEQALDSEEVNVNTAVVTMLAGALLVQQPDLSGEQVVEGVKGLSEWISMFLSSQHPVEKKDIN